MHIHVVLALLGLNIKFDLELGLLNYSFPGSLKIDFRNGSLC